MTASDKTKDGGSSADADTQPVAETPVLADLYCNAYEGVYVVTVDVRATLREEVNARTEVEARDKVLAMIEANEIDIYGEDVGDTVIRSVRRHQPMYLVMRAGEPMGVSHVQPGDLPREPTSEWEASRYLKPTTASSVGIANGDKPKTLPTGDA